MRCPAHTTNPSATLSSSADFPLARLYDLPSFRRFHGGMRRASPVARRVLVTVLSLPPRRSSPPLQPACDVLCCLHPLPAGSASRANLFRGHLCVYFRYGP